MVLVKWMKVDWKRPFWKDDDGAILAEALIVIPVVTIFAIGILEFGNVFWQRQMLEVGVRDAARYWARCAPNKIGDFPGMPCSEAIAQNLAIYGKPTATGDLRVPNWQGVGSVTIEPAVGEIPSNPKDSDVVVVTGTMTYSPSPLFGFLRIGNVDISYTHQQRYYGW